MAGAQEEDALVGVTSRNLVEGRCRYIPTEDVPCVRHDNCLRCGTIGNRMQPWADHSVNFLGGSRVERAGNGGFSYLLGVWIAGHRRRVYEGRESGEKDGYMKTDEHLSSKITFFCENVSRAGGFFRPSGSRLGGGTVSGAGQWRAKPGSPGGRVCGTVRWLWRLADTVFSSAVKRRRTDRRGRSVGRSLGNKKSAPTKGADGFWRYLETCRLNSSGR